MRDCPHIFVGKERRSKKAQHPAGVEPGTSWCSTSVRQPQTGATDLLVKRPLATDSVKRQMIIKSAKESNKKYYLVVIEGECNFVAVVEVVEI